MSDAGATTRGPATDRPTTESDLARARVDSSFRRQLAADHLGLLLNGLQTLRGAASDPERARQIREGAELAVRLAALLQRLAAVDPTSTAQPDREDR